MYRSFCDLGICQSVTMTVRLERGLSYAKFRDNNRKINHLILSFLVVSSFLLHGNLNK